ncbi:MAG: beta-hydroxyacyl-ACP dehydratase [Oscillospiraceae bacterium]|nr:beta-hydroxyacyl-ACP dehydratase [Oscillospiraceae bacterium]
MTLTLDQIKTIIPQRDPILLVDEVTDLIPNESIEARFYVSPSLSVFQGHFPDQPILPGVYSVESLAQTADILLLSMERYQGKTPLFIGIDRAKFKRKVLPGMHMCMTARIAQELPEKSIVSCDTASYNAKTGDLCVSAVVTLAMR